MSTQIDNEEEPLDPVMERVRVRMVRLLMISIGIMVIALMSILFAIVYKISNTADKSEAELVNNQVPSNVVINTPLKENIEIDLPIGASVVSSNLVANRLVLDVRLGDGQSQFWIIDLSTGAISRVTTK